jgi:hypothetical protein
MNIIIYTYEIICAVHFLCGFFFFFFGAMKPTNGSGFRQMIYFYSVYLLACDLKEGIYG